MAISRLSLEILEDYSKIFALITHSRYLIHLRINGTCFPFRGFSYFPRKGHLKINTAVAEQKPMNLSTRAYYAVRSGIVSGNSFASAHFPLRYKFMLLIFSVCCFCSLQSQYKDNHVARPPFGKKGKAPREVWGWRYVLCFSSSLKRIICLLPTNVQKNAVAQIYLFNQICYIINKSRIIKPDKTSFILKCCDL